MLTVEDILADALVECGDEGYRKYTRGWYVAQIKFALQELEFDTLFRTEFLDEIIPSTLRVNTPEGGFGIVGVWVYNGGRFSNDATRVYRKSGMMTNGGGDGYAANNVQGMEDEQVNNTPADTVSYYYGIQNGVLMLSDACSAFQKCRIVYKGFSKSIMDMAIIPPMIREAVLKFVVVKYFSAEMAKDRSMAAIYDRKYAELYRPMRASVWDNARYRLSRLSPDQLRTIKLYWGHPPV